MSKKPIYSAVLAALAAAAGVTIAVASSAQAAPVLDAPPPVAHTNVLATTQDTQPPTTPTELRANYSCTADGWRVTLSWAEETDNVGVVGYDVYRAGTQTGTPELVSSTPTTSFEPTSLSGGWAGWYSVRARDAVGNASDSSETQLVLPPPSPCPRTTGTPPVSTCTATYSQLGSWQGGFQGLVKVTNTGTTATTSWTVTLTFHNGESISQLWAATTTDAVSPYAIHNASFNGALAPDASTSLGLIGSSSGTNTAPTVTCVRTP